MAKKGMGRDSFSTNAPVSTTAPRAPGPAGKGGNWRAGIPSHGAVLGSSSAVPAYGKYQRPAAQGGSCANMGDAMPAGGHNAPRGYGNSVQVKRSILSSGSTPLTRKKYKAASVEG